MVDSSFPVNECVIQQIMSRNVTKTYLARVRGLFPRNVSEKHGIQIHEPVQHHEAVKENGIDNGNRKPEKATKIIVNASLSFNKREYRAFIDFRKGRSAETEFRFLRFSNGILRKISILEGMYFLPKRQRYIIFLILLERNKKYEMPENYLCLRAFGMQGKAKKKTHYCSFLSLCVTSDTFQKTIHL